MKGPSLNEFILRRTGKTWDAITPANASIKDIDEKAVKYFLQKALKSNRITPGAAKEDTITLLKNLHLVNDEGNPKNAALLLFSHNPQKYFTTSYFKIGKFGESDADLRFQDIVEGNLIEMADKVMDILRSKYLVSPIRYEGLQRIEELEYPEPALREAILNSIVHKNYTGPGIQLSVYDNKIVLWNPGRLPDELSVEILKDKHPSYPRNNNIAEVFFKAGYIEAWGRGIFMIMDTCRKAGLPEPAIEEVAGGIQITFLKNTLPGEYFKKFKLNERQIKALEFVKEKGSITNTAYQTINNTTKKTSTRDLQDLVEKGLLEKSGTTGKGTFYTASKQK